MKISIDKNFSKKIIHLQKSLDKKYYYCYNRTNDTHYFYFAKIDYIGRIVDVTV